MDPLNAGTAGRSGFTGAGARMPPHAKDNTAQLRLQPKTLGDWDERRLGWTRRKMVKSAIECSFLDETSSGISTRYSAQHPQCGHGSLLCCFFLALSVFISDHALNLEPWTIRFLRHTWYLRWASGLFFFFLLQAVDTRQKRMQI